MAEKSDVRAAIEWAWVNYDACIVRNDQNIATSIDFDKAASSPPDGGRSMLDFAFASRVAFNNLAVKALGTDIDDDDGVVIEEKKGIADMRKLLVRMKD